MSRVKHTAPRPASKRQRYSRALLWCCIAAIFPVSAQETAAPAATEAPAAAAEATTPPAATEAVKTEPALPVAERLAEQQRQLLYDLKGPPTALWLPAGDEQLLAFWQPDRSGKPVGAVLMLHDAGENPRRAATLRRLHEYLPVHGWATFSVELPDLPVMAIPARPTPAPVAEPKTPPSPTEPSADKREPSAEKTEPSAEQTEPSADKREPPAEEKAVDETQVVHQEADEAAPAESAEAPPPLEPVPAPSREEVIANIHQRIEAATAYLHQQGQYNLVLLGEGSSAHWALQHLGKAAPPPTVESSDKKSKGIIDRAFRAVILVNARTPAGAELEPLAEGLRYPEIPTFDVFTDLYLDTLADAQNRRQAAKQQGYESYIVRRLPPPKGADPDNIETLLTKAIRGFLHKYAQGVELK